MKTLPHTRSCFVCGESNPLGLNLRFEADGRIVRARFVPRIEHAGFRGVVHGGIISTVLDEAMVWACAVASRRFAFCAELSVRFLQPARPLAELIIKAELSSDRRGKVFEAAATLEDGAGAILSSARGKYLPIKDADVAQMAEDFVGDAGAIFS
jgi:acyl-coenzyme A thioesterase PaaI-like protein